MRRLLPLLLTLTLLTSCSSSKEMKIYYLVLLKKGPNRVTDPAKAKEIQAGHMANMIASSAMRVG
jgi:hypothetical protein